jgi:hypothetical protein
MPGWRFAFVAVAFLSLLIGGLTLWLGQEPRKLRGAAAGSAIAPKEGGIKLADIAGHMINVMRVPTFGLIVAQADNPKSPHYVRLFSYACGISTIVLGSP